MVALARFFDWRSALVIVKPATFLKWHRNAFRQFWKWKSRRRGRPSLPPNLREIIRRMDRENPTWGEERMADELLVKFGIRVSPRTVRKYLGSDPHRSLRGDQRWATFVRNHAKATIACDFFVSVTATFRVLYVFVAMEIGSRRILHINVTAHPTAEWTIQQFREFLADDHPYRFVIHDRDAIFSKSVDSALKDFGVRALKTPVRTPTANAFCERVIGTIRRECLDFLIPINERHIRSTVGEFVSYYNRGRPHSSLGPGIPEPFQASAPESIGTNCQRVIESHRNRFSAACITTIAWKRRPLSVGSYFLRSTGVSHAPPARFVSSAYGDRFRNQRAGLLRLSLSIPTHWPLSAPASAWRALGSHERLCVRIVHVYRSFHAGRLRRLGRVWHHAGVRTFPGRDLKCLPLYGNPSLGRLDDRHDRAVREALARRPEHPANIDSVLRSHLRLADGRRDKGG